MTDDELAQWGVQEQRIRVEQLARVDRGEMTMRECRELASVRRSRAGLTSDQTARAILLAYRRGQRSA